MEDEREQENCIVGASGQYCKICNPHPEAEPQARDAEIEALHHEAEGQTADILELRERNAQLEQALQKYGRHRETCGRWLCWHTHHVPECCTCGFEVYVGTKSE